MLAAFSQRIFKIYCEMTGAVFYGSKLWTQLACTIHAASQFFQSQIDSDPF